MAILKTHSFNETKISRYQISKKIVNGGVINLRSESDVGSYLNAVSKGVLTEPDGNNIVCVRIDPQVMTLVKSYMERRHTEKMHV